MQGGGSAARCMVHGAASPTCMPSRGCQHVGKHASEHAGRHGAFTPGVHCIAAAAQGAGWGPTSWLAAGPPAAAAVTTTVTTTARMVLVAATAAATAHARRPRAGERGAQRLPAVTVVAAARRKGTVWAAAGRPTATRPWTRRRWTLWLCRRWPSYCSSSTGVRGAVCVILGAAVWRVGHMPGLDGLGVGGVPIGAGGRTTF